MDLYPINSLILNFNYTSTTFNYIDEFNRINGNKSDYKIFSAAFELNGGISIFKNTTPDNVYRMPNKSVIQTIVELNNNFIPLNSQSLPLDIQFENGIYCNNSKLLFSLEEMLKTFEEQPQFRDINLMFLRKGHAAGLFSLPRILLK